jgi:TolB-like protein/Tfp pilus assembly protein PilF
MVENTKNPIRIDLNEFKLHIHLKKIQLTLHFNSPSRRFYLSVMALVVNEMKRLGKITSIPLERHLGLLVLLNETIGSSAGSSDRENLLPRIYRKWKDALPDLEDAPLFKVLGRRKEYDEGIGRTYPFAEAEKDSWANLFEYQGSEENVRLKFAIDRVGATLDDIVIIYGDSLDGNAWERFLSNLKEKGAKSENLPETEAIQSPPEVPESSLSPIEKQKTTWQSRRRWAAFVALIVVIAGAATLATWRLYLKPAPVKRASIEKMAFPLPDKPSIAVLAFTNISGGKELEYFSDGLAEGIINGLSKSEHIFVIARNSTFTYKGKPVKVKQVAEEMGVRYVIEGSVQQERNRVRITVQLTDALSGRHLFSEQYNRDLKDILRLQDEIVLKVLTAVQVKLTTGEVARLYEKGTNNLEAYLKVMQAREYKAGIMNKERVERAKQLFDEAIALDPEYAFAYSILSTTHVDLVLLGASESPRESLQRAVELGKKAIALDDSNSSSHANLSFPYMWLREYDKAISEAEKAVSLSPNSATAYWALGSALSMSGRPQEGIPMLQKSLRLSPVPIHSQVLGMLAHSYSSVGQYEEAIATYKKMLQIYGPDHLVAHIGLAVRYASLDREKEARAEGAEVLRIDPKFSWERFIKGLPFDQPVKDRMADALRKVGLM